MNTVLQESTCTNSETDVIQSAIPLVNCISESFDTIYSEKEVDVVIMGVGCKNTVADIMPLFLIINHERQCMSMSSANIPSLITYLLSQVEEIKQIYLRKVSETLYRVWSIVDEDTKHTRGQIYEKEMNLIRYFKDNLYLDFTIDTVSDADYIKNADITLIFNRR